MDGVFALFTVFRLRTLSRAGTILNRIFRLRNHLRGTVLPGRALTSGSIFSFGNGYLIRVVFSDAFDFAAVFRAAGLAVSAVSFRTAGRIVSAVSFRTAGRIVSAVSFRAAGLAASAVSFLSAGLTASAVSFLSAGLTASAVSFRTVGPAASAAVFLFLVPSLLLLSFCGVCLFGIGIFPILLRSFCRIHFRFRRIRLFRIQVILFRELLCGPPGICSGFSCPAA